MQVRVVSTSQAHCSRPVLLMHRSDAFNFENLWPCCPNFGPTPISHGTLPISSTEWFAMVAQAADCQRECMTLARVCSNLMNEHDIDLAELLYRQVTRAQLSNALCRELSGACKRKPPPFLGPRADGEAFVVMDADQLRMKKMMNDMQAQGMSGSVRL